MRGNSAVSPSRRSASSQLPPLRAARDPCRIPQGSMYPSPRQRAATTPRDPTIGGAMAPAPVLKATTAQAETFAGVTYHVDGELVPVLTVEISSVPVYFEHHILLWKDPRTTIGIKSLAGAFKRILSGMPIFMTEAQGPGRIAFSRDGAGHVFGMHLKQGESLDVREHQFLAATDQLDY